MAARKCMTMNFLSALLSIFFMTGAGGISVKWGTSGGPIVPPTPAPPTPPPQPPFRDPAAVWEDQTGDTPNPNPYRAPVPPHLVHYFTTRAPTPQSTQPPASVQPPVARPPVAHTRYTHVVYKPKPIEISSTTLSPAKAFVNAYAQPTKAPTPSTYNNNIQEQRNEESYRPEPNYQNIESRNDGNFAENYPVPQFGIRYNPGYGFNYITPNQDKDPRKYFKSFNKYNVFDKHNALETNDIFNERQHENDVELSYEKHLAQRIKKSPTQYYVPQQPTNFYQQQLFFPSPFLRH